MLKSEYIDSYYSNLNAIKNDFFQNVLYGVSLVKDNLQKQLTSPQDEYKYVCFLLFKILCKEFIKKEKKWIL